jgi:hypothetical protein
LRAATLSCLLHALASPRAVHVNACCSRLANWRVVERDCVAVLSKTGAVMVIGRCSLPLPFDAHQAHFFGGLSFPCGCDPMWASEQVGTDT